MLVEDPYVIFARHTRDRTTKVCEQAVYALLAQISGLMFQTSRHKPALDYLQVETPETRLLQQSFDGFRSVVVRFGTYLVRTNSHELISI